MSQGNSFSYKDSKSKNGWSFNELAQEAVEHHRQPYPTGRREVFVVSTTRPAIVLGSSQLKGLATKDLITQDLPDGTDVVVRKSGGGLVYLHPNHFVWIDVCIPADDPLFLEDISKSARWLGDVWCEVFSSLGILAEVYNGTYIRGVSSGFKNSKSKLANPKNELEICFLSRASGEVITKNQPASLDKKLVGISQRRTKRGVWFQTFLHLEWRPELFLPYLTPYIYMSKEDQEKCLEELRFQVASISNIHNGDFNSNREKIIQTFFSKISQI